MNRMWRYLRITITALIGFIFLILLLLFILSQLDINQFKETIETQVSELTGRQLILNGDLHLEISLHPALSIENASFANAPWSDRPQMLSIKKLYLKVDLIPMFNKQLVIEQLLLEGVNLSVETNTDGQINWQLEKLSSTDETLATKNTEHKTFRLPFLPVLEKVKFDNVRFYYDDQVSEIQTDIIVDSLQLSNLGINETIDFSSKGKVNKHPFNLSGKTSFLAAVTTQNIAEQGLKVKVDVDALGMALTADGKIENPVAAQGIDIKISIVADDLDKTFTAATGKSIYQYLRKSSKPLSLNLSTRLKDVSEGYAFSKIIFNLAGNDLNGDISFYNHPGRPEIIAKLDSRKINFNQLLPKKYNQNIRSEKKNTGIKLPETVLPFDQLKSLDADVILSIGEINIEEFTPKSIKLNASLKDGLLKVEQLDLTLNDAPIRSSFTINSRTKIPHVSTRLDISNLQLGFITQRLQLEQIKTGTLKSTINLNTRGNNIKSLLLGLKGEANIQLSDVKLEQKIKDKTHIANIKHLKLNYFGINQPLKYNLDGEIDNEPVLILGDLDSPASIINNETLKLNINLAALNINLEAAGTIKNPLEAERAQLNVVIDIPDPKSSVSKLSRFIPGIKQNEKLADLPISVHGLLTATADTYRFEKMRVIAGSNDVSGGIFADLRGSKPFIDAKLESQLIDLNELVPSTILESDRAEQKPKEQTKDSPTNTKLFSSAPLPALHQLDNININLTYNLKKLTSNKQVIDNIYLNLVLKDGLLQLDPLSIDFARGKIKSKLELNTKHKPRFRLDITITKLDYDRLMAILGLKEYAKGELDAEIHLTGEGNSVSTLMASLNGMVRITTVDGVLDSDSLKLLSSDLVSIIPFTDTSDRQKINCGVVQFDIHNGIASVHSMVVNTGAVSALGTGDINLANETISLYIAPRSKRTSVVKIALVPVNVTGPLSSPSVTPDLAGTTISTAKTATNIGLTIITSGVWLLAEGITNDLWDKFIDDTNYCAKALAGDKIVPTRIKLETTAADATDETEDDSENGYETYSTTDDDDDDW